MPPQYDAYHPHNQTIKLPTNAEDPPGPKMARHLINTKPTPLPRKHWNIKVCIGIRAEQRAPCQTGVPQLPAGHPAELKP